MKFWEIIYYAVFGFIVLITLLLIFSTFPVTGNYRVLVVQSGSMEPAIKMGGIVAIKPSDKYKIGDIITFGSFGANSQPITHRVYDMKVADSQIYYLTKGDVNDTPDRSEVLHSQVIGRVIFSVPLLGYAVNFASKPAGFFLLVILPALVIILDEAKKVYVEIRSKNKK